ncbi:NADH-quinone oxidoreductase subunit J [Natrarchaeobaculum aegyptiacum]|uniref:NADH dehydrogenase n=1 Tax=Natrarchaeobaculum aegyptiacum TaxID=745377 RepID=A0A2Z2HUK8_9EURY|nr:NADH-quinone oxidoreductase subunit J [Natrarchaeobaculum aegyptiacum]ARS90939.1 hypothetical protein B1756_15180 [Natrarchaeobaculum aegyptiacum]
MTSRPRLRLEGNLAPGLLAVALFVLMALVVLNTGFSAMPTNPFDVDSVTAAIGYALFDLAPLQAEAGVTGTEPFLAAFLLVAVVLDAALDAALVLAKREEGGEPVSPLQSTGDSPSTSDSDAGRSATRADGSGGDNR